MKEFRWNYLMIRFTIIVVVVVILILVALRELLFFSLLVLRIQAKQGTTKRLN